ncbi:MAG: SIS domain-containing protein, partial [Cyclobacteriaceae bacterium]|nr:SIS domain-containing protein [Cyclobacteriaceae bacterium HetDA_MAG_MS6]
MDKTSIIRSELQQAASVLQNFLNNDENLLQIQHAAKFIVDTIQNGGKVIACGNGGSHCDAMHFAEEFTGKFREDRKALPAIAIADPTHISCVSNDYGFQYVFSRHIEALGFPQDLLLAISTSGNSPNIIEALHVAKQKGMSSIALTGKDGGQLAGMADV